MEVLHKTPQEVYSKIAGDFKRYGVHYATAAAALGYKHRQTITNIFRQNKFMSKSQAKRFNSVFGYNTDALMYGIGDLEMNPSEISLFGDSLISDIECYHQTSDNSLTSAQEIDLLREYLDAFALSSECATQCNLVLRNYNLLIHGQSGEYQQIGINKNIELLDTIFKIGQERLLKSFRDIIAEEVEPDKEEVVK